MAGSSEPARILVVDDRTDVRVSFMYMLEACGYCTADAGDGEEALRRLTREHFDVVLTDLFMPRMDGLGLIRVLRERPRPHPVIVAMTGSEQRGVGAVVAAAGELGADAVLRKPVSKDELLYTLRHLGVEPRT